MTVERRFFFVLACALLAVAALGVAASGPASGARPGDMPAEAAALRAAPPLPTAVLAPVLATSLAERFPDIEALSAPEPSILADRQIVSYYGNPYSAEMGILGSDDPGAIADLLEERAREYDLLNGSAGVVPALHLVYAVAQFHEAEDGLYLQYVDSADVESFLHVAEERDMLLFLDLQIGRSSVEEELEKVLPYLRNRHVHLALDPEFAVAEGQVPGTHLGSLAAPDINYAQEALARLVRREGLPPKLLMVHQFLDSMVLNGNTIERYPNVELIIDMDGFGPAEVKRVKYQDFASRSYAAHGAIKLFLQHDPDLMSAQDVLTLVPRPAVIIYQ